MSLGREIIEARRRHPAHACGSPPRCSCTREQLRSSTPPRAPTRSSRMRSEFVAWLPLPERPRTTSSRAHRARTASFGWSREGKPSAAAGTPSSSSSAVLLPALELATCARSRPRLFDALDDGGGAGVSVRARDTVAARGIARPGARRAEARGRGARAAGPCALRRAYFSQAAGRRSGARRAGLPPARKRRPGGSRRGGESTTPVLRRLEPSFAGGPAAGGGEPEARPRHCAIPAALARVARPCRPGRRDGASRRPTRRCGPAISVGCARCSADAVGSGRQGPSCTASSRGSWRPRGSSVRLRPWPRAATCTPPRRQRSTPASPPL